MHTVPVFLGLPVNHHKIQWQSPLLAPAQAISQPALEPALLSKKVSMFSLLLDICVASLVLIFNHIQMKSLSHLCAVSTPMVVVTVCQLNNDLLFSLSETIIHVQTN